MKTHTYMKVFAAVLCFLMTALMFGCSQSDSIKTDETLQNASPSQTEAEYTQNVKRKVIIDTDTGADDSSALILASKSENIDILGVTVLAGNVDLKQSALNAMAALETAGCDAPVYMGADENSTGEKIEAFSVFGSDGMGDKDLVHPKGKAQDKNAIDYILDTVKQNPGEIEIICLGPATNIAKAIEKDPGTMKQVKMIWSMGSAGLGPGNATPVAEFNVYSDPQAYNVMLESGIDITVIGLDMCGGDSQWTNDDFTRLESSGSIGKFVTDSFTKIREFYAANGSENSVMNCDSLAMTCAVYDNFIKDTVKCHASCLTEDTEARGEVIFYKEGFTYDVAENDFDYNVTLVTDVAGGDYFGLYLKAVKQ